MIVDPIVLLAFVPASLALNLTPGADMMFSLGQGMRSGPAPAIWASAGISAGSFVHTGLAGLGLSAVIAALPWAFDAIRWLGVAYLLWLARGAIRQGVTNFTATQIRAGQAFRQGLLINLTNPKVILFVLAFIPQFVDAEKGNVLVQFLLFGAILGIGGFVINGAVGVFASSIGRRIVAPSKFSRRLGYLSGTIFAALAIRLAFLEKT